MYTAQRSAAYTVYSLTRLAGSSFSFVMDAFSRPGDKKDTNSRQGKKLMHQSVPDDDGDDDETPPLARLKWQQQEVLECK